MFGHFEPIWDGFGRYKYLVIWLFGQKNELWQAPTGYLPVPAILHF
jgi:hypothetical protein